MTSRENDFQSQKPAHFEGRRRRATESSRDRSGRGRRAAWIIVIFLAALTPINVYWALGGKWGVLWVVGCDCIPAALVWFQQFLILIGIVVVLARAGIWNPGVPKAMLTLGIWGMTATFGAISLWNFLGDNTLQARIFFAPAAAALCGLSFVVARNAVSKSTEG